MTLIELITMALKDIGAWNIGQPFESEEAQDAINALNTMVDMWNIGLAIYCSTEESFALTAGQSAYTWGIATPAADFNSARPVKLNDAFIRDSANNDFPVDLISEQQWDEISVKTDQGIPYVLFYNPTYPLSTVNLYYAPDLSSYTLHTGSDKDLGTFTTLTSTISLPPEYLPALRWNLAAELCPSYKKPVPAKVEIMAEKSLAAIKRLHASEKLKPVKINDFPAMATESYWRQGDIRSGQPY